MKTALLILGGVALAACADGSSEGPVASVLRLEAVERFGSAGDAGSALTQVADVAVSARGVFILESEPPRVAVFSHAGEWLRDIGRSGDGPGEFRRPTALGFLGDSLWVADPSGGRLDLFHPDGTHFETLRWGVPADSLGTRGVPIALFADGSVLVGPPALPVAGVVRGLVTHQNYYRASRDGVEVRELYRDLISPSDFTTAEVSSGRFALFMHPLRESPIVATHPDGSGLVVLERSGATSSLEDFFGLLSIRSDGFVDAEAQVPYTPIPTEEWKASHVAELVDQMSSYPGALDQTFISSIGDAFAARDYYPPATELVLGVDGTVWVRREEVTAESVTWNVFDDQGLLIGTLEVPAALQIAVASLEEVWVVELDEFDVPFVVRMRVER